MEQRVKIPRSSVISMIKTANTPIALKPTLPERSVRQGLRPERSLAEQASANFGSLPKHLAVANTLQRLGNRIASVALNVIHKADTAFRQVQQRAVDALSPNFGSLNKKAAMLMIAVMSGNMINARAGGVVNDLAPADIDGQGGATVLQSGTFNLGQYGIVTSTNVIPQEVSIIVSGNAIGNSFDVSQHHYKLNVNSAILSEINAGPRFVLDMGPALKKDGTPAGTVTTPEGWVVYNSETYHSKSGQSTNAYDDNHQLYFRIAALDPNSPSFNQTAYNFYTTSTVTRFTSVQSHSYTTAGVPQLGNDSNAPVSVYKDSSTSAYVAGPRPTGAAMDVGASGQLIEPKPVIGTPQFNGSGQASVALENFPVNRRATLLLSDSLINPDWNPITNMWVTSANSVMIFNPNSVTNKFGVLRLRVEP